MEILKIEDLTKVYGSGDNAVTALDHVSFLWKEENLYLLSDLPAPANLHCFIFSEVWTVPHREKY